MVVVVVVMEVETARVEKEEVAEVDLEEVVVIEALFSEYLVDIVGEVGLEVEVVEVVGKDLVEEEGGLGLVVMAVAVY